MHFTTTIMLALGALSTQALGAAIDLATPGLAARDFKYDTYHCWGSKRSVEETTGGDKHLVSRSASDELRDGIEYLRGVGGTPKQAPKSCGRVSCSYWTAIYWCNNNDETHYLRSFDTIADGAQFLLDKCGGDGSPFGEVYTDNNWGVRVVSDPC
ncbi:hypothetical protein BJX63DRAFT_28448 [Aspergillus granulosus]|uniref:Uncharacterized protein n=1 Tax=Aspergillus granulosus TaxID=176169 RepID=A0ABR4HUS5_9EURO